jgi:hypothetical protein
MTKLAFAAPALLALATPVFADEVPPAKTFGIDAAGELGITFGYASVDTQFGEMSDSDTDLGIMLAAGLRRGKLDVRGGLFVPDSDDATGFIAAVGFDL